MGRRMFSLGGGTLSIGDRSGSFDVRSYGEGRPGTTPVPGLARPQQDVVSRKPGGPRKPRPGGTNARSRYQAPFSPGGALVLAPGVTILVSIGLPVAVETSGEREENHGAEHDKQGHAARGGGPLAAGDGRGGAGGRPFLSSATMC